MVGQFDFIQSYRDLDPDASREIIDARQKSHDKIQGTVKSMLRVFDLCKIAFLLEAPSEAEWFEKPIRDLDPHFLLKKDKAEAGKLAALLLRERLTWTGGVSNIAVLTTSFCGRRHSADADALTMDANDALSTAVRLHRTLQGGKPIVAPKFKSAATEIANVAASNPVPGEIVRQAIEAVLASTEAAAKSLAEATEASQAPARADIVRLAEEVDMLWWHIGDWHELLEKPRSDANRETKILASGIELGTLVRQVPGPYGAYGLLRRIAASDADAKTSLRAAVTAVSQVDAGKLARNISPSSASLVPVHTALQALARTGTEWDKDAGDAVSDVADMEISFYELGLQAYRERILIDQGSLD
ncbi:GTPase-associated system all-helical protein GASH [Mesorhizobium newzealandense]|uniref:GTPase-associated system all-helical protein GASH n=1 Tax=Mesorhizobium newzealandense TaxID=1300302 RepID=A0ABW4UM08_9HYPH